MKPIDTRSLFKPLHNLYLEMLSSMEEVDWNKQTLASKWTVKEVASHLLDGDLRVLSMQRDGYLGVDQPSGGDYNSVVSWLNDLNHKWVAATKRLSPDVLIMLTQITGQRVADYFENLDLYEEAIFPVSWAGEQQSLNWMHIAREYTERWHHQQQIREAVGEGNTLLERKYFQPLIHTFMLGLPHLFRNMEAPQSTTIEVLIDVDKWCLNKMQDGWELSEEADHNPSAVVHLPKDVSWKLFCKNVHPKEVRDQVHIHGNQMLGLRVLDLVAVMA
jgi:hypothetical protein